MEKNQTPKEALEKKIEALFEENQKRVKMEKEAKNKLYRLKPFEKYIEYNITPEGLTLLKKYPLPKKYEKDYSNILEQKRYGSKEQSTGAFVIEYLKTLEEREKLEEEALKA